MNPKDISDSLDRIASSDECASMSSDLVDEWSHLAEAFDAVEPILRFMEGHTALDFGMPGPLVHFVEQFYGRGYEKLLIESISRKPTSHTLWMLNRVINGTKEPNERQRLIGIMKGALDNSQADASARGLARRLLGRLSF